MAEQLRKPAVMAGINQTVDTITVQRMLVKAELCTYDDDRVEAVQDLVGAIEGGGEAGRVREIAARELDLVLNAADLEVCGAAGQSLLVASQQEEVIAASGHRSR